MGWGRFPGAQLVSWRRVTLLLTPPPLLPSSSSSTSSLLSVIFLRKNSCGCSNIHEFTMLCIVLRNVCIISVTHSFQPHPNCSVDFHFPHTLRPETITALLLTKSLHLHQLHYTKVLIYTRVTAHLPVHLQGSDRA